MGRAAALGRPGRRLIAGAAVLLAAAACALVLTVTASHSRPAQERRTGTGPPDLMAPDAITPATVRRLQPAWSFRTGHLSGAATPAATIKFQVTPIYVAGRLVLCTPFSEIIALDPETGAPVWRFDPQIDRTRAPANSFNCRGIASWRDPKSTGAALCATRILAATLDRRLIALDHRTGAPCPDFGDRGTVAIDPPGQGFEAGEIQSSSVPAVIGERVIVGSSLADNRRSAAPAGLVHAFDVRTGERRWSFDPLPRTQRQARAQGWPAPARVGHANVWAQMATDPARGLVFLPTSSASPDYFGGDRPGDNRHANSLVAVEADTGQVRWAFQFVRHDVWDYDLPAQPILTTLELGSQERDVIVQLTKMGLVFVLDRATGEPVFPVEERPAPQGGVPGEALAPVQLWPATIEPLIDPDDVEPFGLVPWEREACRRQMAGLRHDGLYTPPTETGSLIYPFSGGGVNWGGGGFDDRQGLLVVNVSRVAQAVRLIPQDRERPVRQDDFGPASGVASQRGAPYAVERRVLLSPMGVPCTPPPWGTLIGLDIKNGRKAWEVPLGTSETVAPFSIAWNSGTVNLGGPLVMDSGVTFIAAAGDLYLRAFETRSGRLLWQTRLPAGGQATPMTYRHKARTYVVQAAGGHGGLATPPGDWVLAYALPGPRDPVDWAFRASQLYNRPGMRAWGWLVASLLLGLGAAAGLRAAGLRVARRRPEPAARRAVPR